MAEHPLSLSPADWEVRARSRRLPAWRGRQIYAALHAQRIETWEQAAHLPAGLRRELSGEWPVIAPEVEHAYASTDGTVRYLLRLADGAEIEAVYLPLEEFEAGGRRRARRHTFCISSQAGCAVGCRFCLTAQLGLERNLAAGEIVAQVYLLLRRHGLHPGAGGDRLNLVYMGMGEPLLNYAAVMASAGRLTEAGGLELPPRRMTLSTAGIVDKIRQLGGESPRPRLAISLHASTDELRERLVPLHRGQGGLEALLRAAREYPLAPRERLTFEYVLLGGVNDSLQDARRLARLLAGMRAKVNLIPWNAGPGLAFEAPPPERVREFQAQLNAGGLPAWIRHPRGQDIYAACGQLARAAAPGGIAASGDRPLPAAATAIPAQPLRDTL